MRRRSLASIAGASLLAISLSFLGESPREARGAPPPVPKIDLPLDRFVLPNGLEVVLHEDHKTPIVAVNIWYHVGSKDEPAGKNGFAHLFEHLMFQGSKNVAEDMFFKYLDRAGASEHNGSTNSDRTNYHETVPSNQLELALWLESDRMGTLLDHVDEKTFESQREVVLNERRQNYENAPYGLVHQFVAAALFPPDHPYHLLTIGSPEDLGAATLDDVRAFFKTYYVPNNATLVIAGDFEPKATRALVEKYFASIPRAADPPTKRTPIPVALKGEQRLDVEADVELPKLIIAWPTPPFYAPGDAELDATANVLAGDSRSSRLYKRLVYDLQVAQDVSAGQASSLLGSEFEINVTLKKNGKLEDVLKMVDEELDKLRKTEPTGDEVDRARTNMTSSIVYRMETMTDRADVLNDFADYTHDPGYIGKDLARYEALTPAALKNAVTTWLSKDKRVVTFVRPTKGAPRAGRLKGAAQ